MNALLALFAFVLLITIVAVIVGRVMKASSHGLRYPVPENEMDDLPQGAALFVQKEKKCPFCHGQLFAGPGALGTSQNIYCGNVEECGEAINISLIEGMDWGQYIGRAPDDFQVWARERNAQ